MTPATTLDSPLDRRFDVLATLRRAAGSAVLRVRDRNSGEIRVLETRTAKVSEQSLQRARRILDLRHAGLAPVEEIERSDHGVYWLRRDLGDVSLENVFEGGAVLPVPLMVDLLRQVLEALGALHGHGMFVGDLSPADIHLTRNGDAAPRPVLADLGLGRCLVRDDVPAATAVFVGRLRFASPEQFENEAKVGPTSDLYALGLIAYQGLTGEFPIPGNSPSSLIAGHLFRPPTPFGDNDPENRIVEPLRQWVLNLLAKEPSHRGDAATNLRHLDHIAGGFEAADPSPLAGFFDTGADPVRIDLGLEPVEEALVSGDLEQARRLFDALRKGGGEGPAIDEMARRLAAVEGFTHAADVHRLVATAQARLSSGAPAAAVGNLEEARRLVPDDPEVGRLLEHARQALRRSAPAADGPTAMLHNVRDAVDAEASARSAAERRQEADRTAKADRLLEDARARAQHEDFAAAREALSRILALSPDHPEALALLASVDACLRIQEEQAVERKQVERTVSDIHKLLEDGQAEHAKHRLEAAEERFGDQDILETVRFDVTKARLDAEVSRTVQLSPQELQAALAAETAQAAQPASTQGGVPATTVMLPPGTVPEGASTRPVSADLVAEAKRREAAKSDRTTAASPGKIEPLPLPASTFPQARPESGTLPSSLTMPAEALESARREATGQQPPEELPGTVTMPGDVIEQAKQRALEERPPAELPSSVTLPAEALESARRQASGQQPPEELPGTVTMPGEVIEQAKQRALEERPPAELPSTVTMPGDVIEQAKQKALAGRPSAELPGTVTMPGDVIEQAKQEALAGHAAAERQTADVRILGQEASGAGPVPAGAGSVTLPMATIEAAKQRALKLRAEDADQPSRVTKPGPPTGQQAPALPSSPRQGPGSTLPGQGSVTLPMKAVENARAKAEAEGFSSTPPPLPASTAPSKAPPPATPATPHPAAGPATPATGVPATGVPATGVPATGVPAFEPRPAAPPAPSSFAPTSFAPSSPAPASSAPASSAPASSAPAAAKTPRPATPPRPASQPPKAGAPNLSELGFGNESEPTQPPSASTPPRGKARAAPPGRSTGRPTMVIVMVAVLAAVFAASYFLSGRLDTAPATAPPPTMDVAAPDLPPAELTLDAAPWAEIKSLVDAEGEEAIVIGPRFTPKKVELPPGTYKVTLFHPPSGETREATLELESEGEQQLTVSFDVTVEEFLQRAGW